MTALRKGDWMQTRRGGQFWPMDPRAEDVRVDDIAGHLSKICRYNGATIRFYSVAEHSAVMAQWFLDQGYSAATAFWALNHDAGEAYGPDIIRPIKSQPEMAFMRGVEDAIMLEVCKAFDMDPVMPAIVKEADTRILLDERAQIMAPTSHDWRVKGPPLGVEILGLDPEPARIKFLKLWHNLVHAR